MPRQPEVGLDGFPGRLGHGLIPAGSDTTSGLPAPPLGPVLGPAVQLAVRVEGILPATDGHGCVPGGRATMSAPPGPVWSNSCPQIAPGVEAILPATAGQVGDDWPVAAASLTTPTARAARAMARAVAKPARLVIG